MVPVTWPATNTSWPAATFAADVRDPSLVTGAVMYKFTKKKQALELPARTVYETYVKDSDAAAVQGDQATALSLVTSAQWAQVKSQYLTLA